MTPEEAMSPSEHHRRKRKRKRRGSGHDKGSIKSLGDGIFLFVVLSGFVLALVFCLWMIIPPLIEYLGRSEFW